ncbi:MAG: fluoride efflux transporter CrcB [Chloroflexota bacterium]
MNRFLFVALGAALGANARYIIGLWAAGRFGAHFPYGTLIVNVLGSLFLGFVVVLTTERLTLSPETRLLLAVGFLGSFTTFSSFAVESVTLSRDSGLWTALINIFGNNLLALAAALIGAYFARVIS